MRRHALSSLMLLTVACAHAPETAEAGAQPLERGSIKSGGLERTFAFFVPAGASAQKRPLVIGLHGRLGDGKGQDKLGRMSAVAAREGFVLALPDGYSRSWHDARDHGPAADAHVDDVAFLSALIDWFIAEKSVDPRRVYVMGMSNGGFMTLTVACTLADKVAAVASVTGSVSENLAGRCAPARPVPVALFLGDQDPLVPYGGGEVARNNGRALSAKASAQLFVGLDGCAAEPAVRPLPDTSQDDGSTVELQTWSGCQGGAEVRLYTVHGGGHTWPGGHAYLPEAFIGATNRDVEATPEAWAFFKDRALPAVPTATEGR